MDLYFLCKSLIQDKYMQSGLFIYFWSPKSNSLVILLIALFHYSVWAFVNGSDTLMTDLSLLMLLKLNSVY